MKGGSGGKVEYMIEIRLGTKGHLKKKIILAHQIITVALAAKLDITENGLKEEKESISAWPQEQGADVCLLSACIPHGGWLRGTSVEVQINFKQPEVYEPV